MFCPKCKAEYEDWVKECADCKVTLVYKLQPEPNQGPKQELIKYKEVLSTYNQGDIVKIKSVLDSAGITYYIKDERILSPLWFLPMVLMVREDQALKAIGLLKNYKLEFRALG